MAQKRGESRGASRERAQRADRRRRGSRRNRRRRQNQIRLIAAVLLCIALIILSVFAVRGVYRFFKNLGQQETTVSADGNTDPAGGTGEEGAELPETETAAEIETRLSDAAKLAAMYDYDGAIALLGEDAETAASAEAQAAIAEYEAVKATLVRQDPLSVTHVFFHILVVDSKNAFDKSKWGKQADGYNSLMTTIPEFRKMLDELYADGFVLVRLHDLASMQQTEDGSMKMVQGDIMLPPGKKAMVMSQDDVCYYEYMEGAGYAERMIIGEDGRPTCVYVDENGQEQVGEYDLVPILDKFIDEHPDFSYKGAKACIAFTGYNGILGYRTDETYDQSSDMYDSEKKANPNIAEDRETAKAVAAALKADGYELASHSWGHRDLGQISLEHLKKDTDRWDRNVNQALLNGECDIILYPKGSDVADWHSYSHDNAKFDYLWNKGFRYFCNVDATQTWVQIGSDYVRQGRRPLDGLALWNNIANGKNRLSDLFADVSAIFDPDRPTPVPNY
ncbi:MAG: polysaccharide deacetylase [Eubacteriales bacterium]|nr:polysaccharide deacetylase [Eubacteriales bacterium]